MTIRHLKVFVEVCENSSITKTAEIIISIHDNIYTHSNILRVKNIYELKFSTTIYYLIE